MKKLVFWYTFLTKVLGKEESFLQSLSAFVLQDSHNWFDADNIGYFILHIKGYRIEIFLA